MKNNNFISKFYKYINRNNADSEEKKLVLNKEKEDKKNLKKNLSISFCIFLISFFLSFVFWWYPLVNGTYEVAMSIFTCITFSLFLGLTFLVIKVDKNGNIN